MAYYFRLKDCNGDDGWIDNFNRYIGKTIALLDFNDGSYRFELNDYEGHWGIKSSWLEESTKEEFDKDYPLWSTLEEGDYVVTNNGRHGRITCIENTSAKMRSENSGSWIVGFADILDKYTEDDIPNLMDIEGVKADESVEEVAIDEMKTLLEEYDYKYSSSALSEITEEWNRNKAKLRALLKRHPKWDESLQMVVLKKQPFTKEVSWEDIKEFNEKFFCERAHAWAEENQFKIGFFTYNEYIDMKDSYDRRKSLLMACEDEGIAAKYRGMDINEMKLEIRKMNYILNKAANHSVSLSVGIKDYRFGIDKVYDMKYLKRVSLIMERIYEDRGVGFFENNVFSKDGVVRCERIILDTIPKDVYDNMKTKIKPQVGQSLPKWIGKVCSYYGFDKYVNMITKVWHDDNGVEHSKEYDAGYNKYRAILGDACTNIIYKEDVYISINPIDYLTQSFLYNATSCHSIDKKDLRNCHKGDYQGCYSSGTVSYMLDEPSLVMYTIKRDGDKVNRIGKEADPNAPVYRVTKLRRMMAYVGEDKLICSRVYPDGRDGGDLTISDQFRDILQKVLSECANIDNSWRVEPGTTSYGMKKDYATCYADWTNYSDCSVSFHTEGGRIINYKSFYIGEQPICVVCGERHNNAENITCEYCLEDNDSICQCADCGDDINLDRDNYIEAADGTIFCCFECAENADYRRAEDRDQWYHMDDLLFDSNYESYYYDDSCRVDVDDYEYTFVDSDSARDFGCVYDEYEDEWTYNYADDLVTDDYSGCDFITSWHSDYVYTTDGNYYVDQDNAIADGYEYDSETGDWVRKSEDEEVA